MNGTFTEGSEDVMFLMKNRRNSGISQYKLTSFNTILIDDISNSCLGIRSCFEGKVMTLQSLLTFFYLVSVVT